MAGVLETLTIPRASPTFAPVAGSLLSGRRATVAVEVSFLQSLGGHGFSHLAAVTTQRRTRPLPLVVEAGVATRRENRTARHSRVRKKVEGTPERPRLCVFRSNKHIYVQVIDDTKMHTLASASTMQKPISDGFDYTASPTIDVARKIGEVIAKSCVEKGITKVAFDRGGYPYHGRIQALADAAREHGLDF